MNLLPMTHHPTNEHYSPWDQLPAPVPSKSNYFLRHFYENTAKHLIKDFVRIMNNGLHIDLYKVKDLEVVLDEQLKQVETSLATNPLIHQFQQLQHKKIIAAYVDEQKSKIKPASHFLKPFKHKDMVHRSYFMYIFAQQQNISQPTELLPGTSVPKWEAKLVKKLSTTKPLLVKLLDGTLSPSHSIAIQAMQLLAEHKAAIYNAKYLANVSSPSIAVPPFNPGSSKQKQELFVWLGIESEATSKDTGLPSWDRDQIERINKTTSDDYIRDFTQSFIDQSFAAIVRNNFIQAFYKYTVDSRLYGTLKLLGAKTFRPTANRPNFLNMPSTGSIFAKPIKACFTAPSNRLVWTIDYSALI